MKKVNRVEQQIIKRNNPIYKIVDQYCFYSKNVYNQANYIIRQEFINNNNKLSAYDVQKLMQSMDCYKECGSQAAQKTIQLVDKMWKSYFKAIKDWKKNPSKYLGMPKLPKYLPKDGRQVFMLKNIQCSLNDGQFRIAFKPFGGYTVNTHAVGKLMQCRFVPKADYYVMEIVYEIEVPETENIVSERIAAIDLGVDNLMTITTNCGVNPIIINGKPLKAINQYCNKKISEMRSALKLRNDSDWSNEMQRFTTKRNNQVDDYIQKSTKMVIDFCRGNDIDTLVCGYNSGWKQDINMGKRVNQKFVSIPYLSIVQRLEYKCENEGIKFIKTNESYTSGTSFLDGEEPIEKNYNKDRRIHRGLFQSEKGEYINADVNGSYQIMKKVFPKAFVNGIVGAGSHPVVVNIPLQTVK